LYFPGTRAGRRHPLGSSVKNSLHRAFAAEKRRLPHPAAAGRQRRATSGEDQVAVAVVSFLARCRASGAVLLPVSGGASAWRLSLRFSTWRCCAPLPQPSTSPRCFLLRVRPAITVHAIICAMSETRFCDEGASLVSRRASVSCASSPSHSGCYQAFQRARSTALATECYHDCVAFALSTCRHLYRYIRLLAVRGMKGRRVYPYKTPVLIPRYKAV